MTAISNNTNSVMDTDSFNASKIMLKTVCILAFGF
jgi:hypothetical protein